VRDLIELDGGQLSLPVSASSREQARKEANHRAEHPPGPRPGPGDISLCPETAAYGELSCPRLEPLAYILGACPDSWLSL